MLNFSSNKNSKKKFDFQKFIRKNSYEQERHGSINYSKFLKCISDNRLLKSNTNISISSNINENLNNKYQDNNNVKLNKLVYININIIIIK